MSGNSSVIREFLVSLGFVTDEASLKRFQGGIEKATKSVVTLATAVEATAATVAIGIAKFASNLEELYFASQRTGVAVQNIKAFERAAQNLGASAEDAQSAIEGLSHAYRTNPFGTRSIVSMLGGNPNDENIKQLLELVPALQKLPTNVGLRYAQMLGLSERMYLALRSGQFAQDYAHSQKLYGSTDWKRTAEDAHQFGMAMRDLSTVVQAFGAQVYEALQKRLGGGVEKLTAWIQKNGPQLATRIVEILSKIWDIAVKIVDVIRTLVDYLIKWDHATNGWSTTLLGTLAVLKLIGGTEIVGGVLSLAAAFVRLGAGIAGSSAAAAGARGLAALIGAVPGAGAALAVGGGVGLGYLVDKLFPNNPLAKLGDWIGNSLYDATHRDQEALQYFTDHGWSHAQAAGLVANFEAESGLHDSAVGDNGLAYGIGQWHPDRQAQFQRLYGKPIQGSSYEEQLAFAQWELTHSMGAAGKLLRAAKNAYMSGNVVSRFYEKPAATVAQADARGRAAVAIDQQTTIHVHGSGDPAAAAKLVAREQKGVNADIVRAASAAQ